MVRGTDDGNAGPDPLGREQLFRHGLSGGGVHRRHRRGAGTSVFEAVLCPALCQQGKPPYEAGPVRRAGPVGSGGLGASGRGNGADQGHFRRGRLRRGDAEIHHGGVRHRRSLGGLCRDAAVVRLAAGAAVHGLSAGELRHCGADEAARPAHRRSLQGAGRGLERRHHGSGGQRPDLPGLWPGGGAPGGL